MKPLLSVCMIVKNEARSIRKTLESAKPYADHFTILDTGSTDGTQDIVKEVVGSESLHHGSFEGYAASRNQVLQIDAAGCQTVWQLMLSGDEFLQEADSLREQLVKHNESPFDCLFVWLKIENAANRQARIFRTGSPWKYDDFDCGVHEVPVHPDPNAPVNALDDVFIHHVVSDFEKRMETVEQVHIPLLRAALDRNPNNERALIFLAQSHEALMNYYEPWEKITYAMESMALLKRRLQIQTGTAAERNHCEMQYLDHARVSGIFTDEEIYRRAEELYRKDPQRPEPALVMAQTAMSIAMAEKKGASAVPQLYEMFRRAADLAANAGKINSTVPIPLSIGSQAHYYAAALAKQIAAREPDFLQIAFDHVKAGLAMGGSKEVFDMIGLEV